VLSRSSDKGKEAAKALTFSPSIISYAGWREADSEVYIHASVY